MFRSCNYVIGSKLQSTFLLHKLWQGEFRINSSEKNADNIKSDDGITITVTSMKSVFFRKWNLDLEGVYKWNFIPRWNSSRDEIIPVYGEMSRTVYTFLPRWNFIPGWTHPGMKDRGEISSRDEKKKEKKTCKLFILGWNFKMSMFLINFWRMYSNMLSKVNVFEHNKSMNIMKHKASL